VEVISVIVLFVLGLVTLWLMWPARRRGSDWRALYESAMTGKNSDVLRTLVYETESVVRSRQKELRKEPSDFLERGELATAETAVIRLKSEKLRWPVLGVESGKKAL